MAERPLHRNGPEVVHVGSACRDILAEDPRGWRLGGGVTYAALTTARLGLRTAAVVGVDREARDAHELDLIRQAGADLILVPLDEGPVYHNVETPAGRVQTCVRAGDPLPIPPLPESWLAAPAWGLAPVADEIDDRWAEAVPVATYLALAWQGMLRTLVAGARVTRRTPRSSEVLRRADLVGVSHHDLDRAMPVTGLAALLHPGARLVVTRGAEGGLVVTVGVTDEEAVLHYRSVPSRRELDPTGAGDTFLAALLSTVVHHALGGRRRSRAHPEIRFAAAAASLVVEGPGLSAVPDRSATLARLVEHDLRRLVDRERLGNQRVGADPT